MKQGHQSVIKEEFARRADKIVNAPSFNDADMIARVMDAVDARVDDRILDVACGTGVVAFQLGQVAHEVVGLDITGELLQRARKQRHHCGMTNVHFELGQAESLPFAADRFDASVCRMSVHHFEEPQRAIQEMVRVTRPGGRVVVADIVSSDDEQEARLHNAIERLRDPSHVRMLTEAELTALLDDCGLELQESRSWKKERWFEEWADVLNAPEREEPLAVLMEALARAEVKAGVNLHFDEAKQVTFEHTWLLIKSLRPAR